MKPHMLRRSPIASGDLKAGGGINAHDADVRYRFMTEFLAHTSAAEQEATKQEGQRSSKKCLGAST